MVPYFDWYVLIIIMPANVRFKSCRCARECVSFVYVCSRPEPIMLLKLPIMLLSIAPNFYLLCPNYAPFAQLCPFMLHKFFHDYFIKMIKIDMGTE